MQPAPTTPLKNTVTCHTNLVCPVFSRWTTKWSGYLQSSDCWRWKKCLFLLWDHLMYWWLQGYKETFNNKKNSTVGLKSWRRQNKRFNVSWCMLSVSTSCWLINLILYIVCISRLQIAVHGSKTTDVTGIPNAHHLILPDSHSPRPYMSSRGSQ